MVVAVSAVLAYASMADDAAGPGKFGALALHIRGEVHRLWIMPHSEDARKKRSKAGYFPGHFIEELGLLKLTGPHRSLDFSLELLTDHKELLSVDFSFVEIQDGDLAHLRKCTRLQQLVLDHTQISDEGLQYVRSLPELRLLGLFGTRVTERAVDELRRSRPDLTVETQRNSKIPSSAKGYQHIDF